MRSQKKRRGLRAIITIVILLAVIAGAAVMWPGAEDAHAVYEAFEVASGDIARTLNFSGVVALVNQESHTTRNRTTVRQIFVKEEEPVARGDKLLQLANGELFRAGFDGVINEIAVAVGDYTFPNMTLIQVCDLDRTQVEIQIDEYDMEKVYVGQPCTVTVLPLGVTFETKITHVSRISESTGAVAHYTATAEVAVPKNVLPGMQATVEMDWTKATDVVTLDMQALAFDEEKQPYALKRTTEGEYERVDVVTGLNDGLRVEIKDGLNAGDLVYAATGMESEESGFTLAAIYKRIFGENVVIIDRSGGFGGGITPGELPEGFEDAGFFTGPEGVIPDGLSEADFPEADRGAAGNQADGAPDGLDVTGSSDGGDRIDDPAEASDDAVSIPGGGSVAGMGRENDPTGGTDDGQTPGGSVTEGSVLDGL